MEVYFPHVSNFSTISCNFRTISYFPAWLWLTIDRLPNFWAVIWSYQGLTTVNHCMTTFARLHGKWLWLTFDRLLSFCAVTWYHLCVLPLLRGYMVSVGKFFSRGSIWSFSCCQICAWTINANEPINIWKHDRRSVDESQTMIAFIIVKSIKGCH